MQRLTASIAFLSLPLATLSVSACSTQECTYLNDCPSAQMCSPEGRCIADEDGAALLARNGGGEIGLGGGDDVGDVDPNDVIGIGDVGQPSDATMSGSIGPVGGFDGPAVVSVFADADFGLNIINVTSETGQGYGLFILSLANGIEALPVGTTTIGIEGLDGGATYVQVCSDSDDGMVHFDGIAEETVVTVTPNDDEGYDVDVTTTITEGFDGWSYEGAEPTVLHVSFTIAD